MDADRVSERAAVHPDGPRSATVYPATPPLPDPELSAPDATTSWAVILVVLLLVPPIGWLLLARRSDVDPRMRLAVAVLMTALFASIWGTALHLLPAS